MNKTAQSHLLSTGAESAIPTTHSTADQEVLVKVEGVSKKFCRSLKKSLWYGLCDIAGELNPMSRKAEKLKLGNSENGSLSASQNFSMSDFSPAVARDEDLRDGEFYAVRDVSFELRRGECLGLIGHNGAGKTTLLKMLNGLIKPDAGRITMRGRVGALIALGAGFNPILTGRENIYINGSVLGLSKKEIDEKIDEIIDFAEIREFIDTPVQNYSSGMSVRLGFSIASSLSPDVLILDEVLAVGDIGFVIKCLNRMRELSANAAVIFVSHQMQFVSSFCSRVIFMERGRSLLDARESREAIDFYFGLIAHERNLTGSGDAVFTSCKMKLPGCEAEAEKDLIPQGASPVVEMEFEVRPVSEPARVSFSIDDHSGAQVLTCPLVDKEGRDIAFTEGRYALRFDLGPLELNSGKYSVMLAADGLVSGRVLARSSGNIPFSISSQRNMWSTAVRPILPLVRCSQNQATLS